MDGNGTLDSDEMGELSRWVMASFSKDTAALSAAQQVIPTPSHLFRRSG